MRISDVRLDPPDPNSRRARFADWLELTALISFAGQVSISALRTQLRILLDDRSSPKDFDIDADDIGEPEVTERLVDDLEERVIEEIFFRIKTIGSAYPFELVERDNLGRSQILSRKESWQRTETGELVYSFCLLDSGIRDHLVSFAKADKKLVDQIGNVFQICSCVAVGGYTNAEVVSFGFPRATGDGFLPALQAAWGRYGTYTVRSDIPHGFDTKLKDGGIDIIAWRPFGDGHAANLLMFVQVASGLDWKDKPVADDVRSIRQWFVEERFEHFLPAICIPFPLWFDLDEPPVGLDGRKLPFSDGVLRRFAIREATFGVIFDRGRIAQSFASAFNSGLNPGIEGADRIGEIVAWVASVTAALGSQRARG